MSSQKVVPPALEQEPAPEPTPALTPEPESTPALEQGPAPEPTPASMSQSQALHIMGALRHIANTYGKDRAVEVVNKWTQQLEDSSELKQAALDFLE